MTIINKVSLNQADAGASNNSTKQKSLQVATLIWAI